MKDTEGKRQERNLILVCPLVLCWTDQFAVKEINLVFTFDLSLLMEWQVHFDNARTVCVEKLVLCTL